MMHKICKVSDIKEDSLNKFVIGIKEVLVGKRNNKLFACDNSCPHRGASMHKGKYKDNSVVCHIHDYEFDVTSGKLVNMKSWKKSDTWMEQNEAWRRSGDLIMYDIEIKDDSIYIEIKDT